MNILHPQTHAKHILVVDIGTASVNGLLVRAHRGNTPEILSSKRFNLALKDDLDFERAWRHIKNLLRELATTLKSDSRGDHVDLVFVVLSSPWYVSQTRLVHMEPKKEFFVTEGMLKDIIREEEDLFKKKSEKRFSLAPGELVRLESDIMKTALNGYHVRSPFKKKVRFLDVAIYTSFSRREIFSDILEIFRHTWQKAEIQVHSEPILLFRSLQGALDFDEGFLLLDVGGEITEIFLLRKFMIEDMATFGRGGNFLARRLASRLNVPLEEALAFLKLQGRKDAKESLVATLSKSLEDSSKEWAEFFAKALREMCKSGYLPTTLVFLGGGAGMDVLKTQTQSEILSRFTILGKPFRVITLLPENMRKNLDGNAFDRKDPQMTLPLLLVLSATGEYGI